MNIICNCMQVDEETIVSKIKQGYDTVEKIQDETSAGTVCGECIPEIEDLIKKYKNE